MAHAKGLTELSISTTISGSSTTAALIAQLLSARKQAAMLAILEAQAPHKQTKSLCADIKAHIPVLEGHLKANRAREAIATALAMLFLDSNHAVSCMRRDGVLRASRYDYKGALIGRVGKAALAIRQRINASSDCLAYLESIVALSKLAADVGLLQEEMLQTICSSRIVVLKTVLVIVNSLFYHGWLNDHEVSSLDSRRYSSEEYAEAVSLILSTYTSLFPIDDECCNHVDPDALGSRAVVYDRLLLVAIRITKFKNAELMIDGLPYRADLEGTTVTIRSIDPDLERSVRLGYIQSESQAILRVAYAQDTPAISVRDAVGQGFDRKIFQQLIELANKPVRRLRLMLPAVPDLFENIFACDNLFKDELESLLILDVDNFGKFDDLIFNVTTRITSLDLFKLQRYFNFISSVYQRRLADIPDEDERRSLTLTSTVLIVPHDGLVKQLALIFADEAKCREIIALLTIKPGGSYLDLQYRPLVDLGTHYVIAPHVVAASNVVRNVIVANRLRSAAIGPKDRMVQSLTEALQSAGFMVRIDFKIKLGNRELEFDILAWRDGLLFVFECKNAYHPCSVHEMVSAHLPLVDVT